MKTISIKYKDIEKKVVRLVINDLQSSSDDSDDSNEEKVSDMKLMLLQKTIFGTSFFVLLRV